jgi:hypothetical protein
MGAIALAMALAFGLGGRDVAAQMLRGAYENQREQVKQDLRQGKEQAKQDAQRAKETVEQRIEGDAVAPYEEGEPVASKPDDVLRESPQTAFDVPPRKRR